MPYAAQHLAQPPSRDEVDRLPGATVVEFGTPWCGHCQRAQPLIEAALLAPGTCEWLDAAPEPLLQLSEGEVRMALFDPAGWCAHYGHDHAAVDACERLRPVYEHYLVRQRQLAAVLEAHGIDVLYVHVEPGADARTALSA